MDETTNSPVESGDAMQDAAAQAADTSKADTLDQSEQDAPELDADGNPVQPEPEDDSEEVEHEGQKYKVPKALKPLLLMQQDYTRKTQEVAEQRRALEQHQQTVQQQAQFMQENIREVARLQSLDERLAQYQQVDWNALEAQDPFKAQAAFREFTLLRDQRATLAQQLAAKEYQRSEETQRERAKRLQEANSVLARDIKGWGPDLAAKLTDFGKTLGFQEAELGNVDDPRVIKVLHAAFVGQQLLNKQLSAAKQVEKPEVKPAPQVGKGATQAVKNQAQMSTEEWMRWRNQQERKKRAP